MKIKIEQDKMTFGKQKQYIATFATYSATGSTKEEAKVNLLNILEWSKDNISYQQTIIRQLPEANRTIILERSYMGYMVIVSYQDGSDYNTSSYGYISHSEALHRMEQHIENYVA